MVRMAMADHTPIGLSIPLWTAPGVSLVAGFEVVAATSSDTSSDVGLAVNEASTLVEDVDVEDVEDVLV